MTKLPNRPFFIFGYASLQWVEVEVPDQTTARQLSDRVTNGTSHERFAVLGPGCGEPTAKLLRALADAIDEFAARTQPPSRA